MICETTLQLNNPNLTKSFADFSRKLHLAAAGRKLLTLVFLYRIPIQTTRTSAHCGPAYCDI